MVICRSRSRARASAAGVQSGGAKLRTANSRLIHASTTEAVRGGVHHRALTKSAEKPRHSCRGGIGVGRAGLNAQEPNKTHAVPEPSMGEGTAEREAPAFMPGRMSPVILGGRPERGRSTR